MGNIVNVSIFSRSREATVIIFWEDAVC